MYVMKLYAFSKGIKSLHMCEVCKNENIQISKFVFPKRGKPLFEQISKGILLKRNKSLQMIRKTFNIQYSNMHFQSLQTSTAPKKKIQICKNEFCKRGKLPQSQI